VWFLGCEGEPRHSVKAVALWPWAHGFKSWKQPLVKIQGKIVYIRPKVVGPCAARATCTELPTITRDEGGRTIYMKKNLICKRKQTRDLGGGCSTILILVSVIKCQVMPTRRLWSATPRQTIHRKSPGLVWSKSKRHKCAQGGITSYYIFNQPQSENALKKALHHTF
jgi:hypothetical protein